MDRSLDGVPTTAPLLDEVLLARVLRRDATALDALYDRYGSLVYRIALHITCDKAAAEAVVEDVFCTVWNLAGAYQTPPLSEWLISIARRRAAETIAASSYPKQTLEHAVTDRTGQFDQLPDKRSASSQRSQSVTTSLETLPVSQRQALELAYYGNLSCQQIARQLGVSTEAVKRRLRLGLMALRPLLCDSANVRDLQKDM